MNRRIAGNGLLALVLGATAVLLPVRQSEAQSCGQACQECANYWGLQYAFCNYAPPESGYCEYAYAQLNACFDLG
jgi:hypothetical protein